MQVPSSSLICLFAIVRNNWPFPRPPCIDFCAWTWNYIYIKSNWRSSFWLVTIHNTVYSLIDPANDCRRKCFFPKFPLISTEAAMLTITVNSKLPYLRPGKFTNDRGEDDAFSASYVLVLFMGRRHQRAVFFFLKMRTETQNMTTLRGATLCWTFSCRSWSSGPGRYVISTRWHYTTHNSLQFGPFTSQISESCNFSSRWCELAARSCDLTILDFFL